MSLSAQELKALRDDLCRARETVEKMVSSLLRGG